MTIIQGWTSRNKNNASGSNKEIQYIFSVPKSLAQKDLFLLFRIEWTVAFFKIDSYYLSSNSDTTFYEKLTNISCCSFFSVKVCFFLTQKIYILKLMSCTYLNTWIFFELKEITWSKFQCKQPEATSLAENRKYLSLFC